MTALAAPPVRTAPPAVWLARLTVVELRKAVDTRAGRWLLLVIGVGCVAVGLLTALFDRSTQLGVQGALTAQHSSAVNLLLPVVGILLATSEWSRRTALTTYALVPRRHRVTTAKVLAASLLAVAVTGFVLAVSALLVLLVPLWSDTTGRWDLDLVLLAQVTLAAVLFTLGGVAFGLALVSTPLAVVLFFVLPTVLTVLGATVDALREPLQWLDINLTLYELYLPDTTSREWARAATSTLAWVVVPMAVGAVRTARREVT